MTSTIQNIKDIWNSHHGNTEVDLCCIFDGFLCEDNATLVGLGVVGGDTILIFNKDATTVDTSNLKLKKRSAEEITVGLNVLFGEEEELEVLHSQHRDYGPLLNKKLDLFDDLLDNDVEALLAKYDKSISECFDIEKIREFCMSYVYEKGQILFDHHLMNLMPEGVSEDDVFNECEENVYNLVKGFRDTYFKLPGYRQKTVNYDTVFIGPQRNANFTNYLAFPPTVQLSGVNWKTSLRDLLYSYREYSNFNIPDYHDRLYFNNEPYLLDERVFDVYVESLKGLPFHPANLHFSFPFDIAATEDLRCIDDLVSFIEGGDDLSSESKKKKKKRKKKGQQDEVKDDPVAFETKFIKTEDRISDSPPPSEDQQICEEKQMIEENVIFEGLSNNIVNKMENKKTRLENLIDIKSSIHTELVSQKTNLVRNGEDERKLKLMKERDSNFILQINRTDMEISSISNGIDSCDSEIYDLEQRLKKVHLLKEKLLERRNEKYCKLKKLEDEKRGLTQIINTETLRCFEERNKTFHRIEKLQKQLESTSMEIENFDQIGDQHALSDDISDFLDSEIRRREEELECIGCGQVATSPVYFCQQSPKHLICQKVTIIHK